MRRCLSLTAVIAGLALAIVSTADAAGLYAPEYGSGPPEAVAGYSRADDGSLSPLPGSPFAVGPMSDSPGGMIALAFTPDGQRAVASFLFNGGLLGLSSNPTGSVAATGIPILTPSVTGLAVSPDGRFAYAPTREFNSVPAAGILGYSVGAAGSLTELSEAPFGTGAYGDVAITPNAHFLYAATGSQVVGFAIAADGNLTEAETSEISANTLEVSPDGRFLFAGGETGVSSYSIAADGSLSQNGSEALTGNTGLDYFAVGPDGGHIYMPDYDAKSIVTAGVDADGALKVVGSTSVEEAKSVAVSPDGRFLYYARPDLGDIGVASIGADGLPTLLPSSSPWHSGESERLVFQPGASPTASFTSKPAAASLPTSFNATGSTGAAHYEWNFGDGTTLADGGPTPTHTYAKPGAYTVALTVNDAQGCSAQLIYTGQSTVCPGGASARTSVRLDVLAVPKITALSVTNRRFAALPTRAAHVKRGTAFRYSLSEPASVAFTIELKKSGRKIGKRCEPTSRRNRAQKSCPLFMAVGTIAATGEAGANQTKFSGRVRGHKLKPGRYRATALAADSTGDKSAPRSVSFKIVQARSPHS